MTSNLHQTLSTSWAFLWKAYLEGGKVLNQKPSKNPPKWPILSIFVEALRVTTSAFYQNITVLRAFFRKIVDNIT